MDPVNVDTETNKIGHMCSEFFLNSTVHGFRFFAEPKLHWIERVWWMISCVLSVILCVFAVTIIWTKWHEHPVTVTFDDKTTPIAMIPFPAVTICTTQKYKERVNVSYFSSIYPPSLFSNDLNKMDAISQTCNKQYFQYRLLGDNLSIPQSQSIYEAIREISPSKSSVIISPFWMTILSPSYFKPIFTKEGLCFTCNSLNSDELYTDEIAEDLKTVRNNPSAHNWNVENGYQSGVTESTVYPYHVFGTSLIDALSLLVGVVLDKSIGICGFAAPGLITSLHLPDDLPRFDNSRIFVPVEHNVEIFVKPNMMVTSEGLRSYAPHDRGCYFKSERKLRFFRSYSQSKCELECLANFTKKEVGCVRFYMPRDQSTPICRLYDIDGCDTQERNFTKRLMVKQCKCLPDCVSVSYDSLVTSLEQTYRWDSEEEWRNAQIENGFRIDSNILVLFKENNFISLNRSETFTMPDFIASCGGLLGLFMGISMLSVFELIYYFSLRACCKWRRRQKIQSNLQALNARATRNQININ